jgi:hypothetical protein
VNGKREQVAIVSSIVAIVGVAAGGLIFLPAAIPGAVTLVRKSRERKRAAVLTDAD